MGAVATVVRVIGIVWLVLAGLIIAIGYASTLYWDGVRRLMEIASPFNLWNWLAIILTVGPGLLLLQLAYDFGHTTDAGWSLRCYSYPSASPSSQGSPGLCSTRAFLPGD